LYTSERARYVPRRPPYVSSYDKRVVKDPVEEEAKRVENQPKYIWVTVPPQQGLQHDN
jgi:hypothetical protein